MAGIQGFTAGAVLTEASLDELGKQAVSQYASAAARDADAVLTAALREGLTVFLIDTNCYSVYTGSAWSTIGPVHGLGISWTPAVVQLGSVTSTISVAEYSRAGRGIEGIAVLTLTSAGTAANVITMSLPVSGTGVGLPCGSAVLVDASSGNEYPAVARLASATTMKFHDTAVVGTNQMLGLANFVDAVANTDSLYVQFRYRALADG